MQQNDLNEHPQEQALARADDLGQATSSASKTDRRRRKATAILLLGDAVQLLLFGLLAMSIHIHPLLPLDVAITRSFQQNQAPWLRITMLVISYPGSSFLLPTLVLLTVVIFWSQGDRLEAVFVAGLSACSLLLNLLLKVLVHRPRPSGGVVRIIVTSVGYSFPSGHVMAYIAYWGLLFAFGVILFRGRHWWRTALLLISAAFVFPSISRLLQNTTANAALQIQDSQALERGSRTPSQGDRADQLAYLARAGAGKPTGGPGLAA